MISVSTGIGVSPSSCPTPGMGFALGNDVQEQFLQRGSGVADENQLPVVALDHLLDFLLRRFVQARGPKLGHVAALHKPVYPTQLLQLTPEEDPDPVAD